MDKQISELFLFGKKQNWNTELEIFENNFGLTCHIFYKNEKQEVRFNLTEIHHKFGIGWYGRGHLSAFESDIHGTGGTIHMDDIRKMSITKTNFKHKDYSRWINYKQ